MRSNRIPWREALAIAAVVSRVAAFAPAQTLEDEYQAVREEFLSQINQERPDRGARSLRLNATLCRVAQSHAEEIAENGDDVLPFPSGQEILKRVGAAGYEPRFVAQVITEATGDIQEVVSSWREQDPTTYDNALRGEFRDLGIGVAIREEVPLYVFVFGVSMEEFFAEKREELSDLETMRRGMLERVNAERTSRRLPVLEPSPALDRVAQAHAEDMLDRSYYGHKSPEGWLVRERARAGGYRARFVGENIASGQSSVGEVMDGWMASDGHRANILSKVFTEAGFGVAVGKNKNGYQIHWVQCFGRPRLPLGPRPSPFTSPARPSLPSP